MSVKIMGLVWDLDLPQNEKFVLLAYADHADHSGNNIFPAVATIAKKTGYDERSVQRITRNLEEKGYLIPDGKGPKGTNKWRFGSCYHSRGDNLSGVTKEAKGVTFETEGGDTVMSPEPSLTIKEPSLVEIEKSANKKVDFILENERIAQEKLSSGAAWPGREKMPEPIRDLLDVYVKLTGQRPTKGNLMDWLSTGQDWLDLGINKIDLERAYQKSKGEEGKGGFVVGRPGSLTNTANMFAGERRTGNNNNPQINWKGIEETKRMLDEKWGKDYGKPKPISKIVEGMTHDEPRT